MGGLLGLGDFGLAIEAIDSIIPKVRMNPSLNHMTLMIFWKVVFEIWVIGGLGNFVV